MRNYPALLCFAAICVSLGAFLALVACTTYWTMKLDDAEVRASVAQQSLSAEIKAHERLKRVCNQKEDKSG